MKAPVHQIRFGFIKASVFQNQTKVGEQYSVSIVLDLPLVAKAADMAHTWIYEQSQPRERD